MKLNKFKLLVLESIKEALTEISQEQKNLDNKEIDARIAALKQQIVDTQKALADANKQKADKSTEPINTETEDETVGENIMKNQTINESLTLKNFKQVMIEKAKKKGGVWENFGQKELSDLKDKYHYNQYANKWSDDKEYKIAQEIDSLNQWAKRFDLSQLKESIKKTIKEAAAPKEEKVPEVVHNFEEVDTVNPFELRRGIQVELEKINGKDLGNYPKTSEENTKNNETYKKAKETAIKNISKDPAFYTLAVDKEIKDWLGRMGKDSSFITEDDDQQSEEFTPDKKVEGNTEEEIDKMGQSFAKLKVQKKIKENIIRDIIREVLKEDRLGPEFADYTTKKDKVIAALKGKKAEIFTKAIKAIEEVETLQAQIKAKKDQLNADLNGAKEKR